MGHLPAPGKQIAVLKETLSLLTAVNHIEPKTWRLRNLLRDLSGKEEMLHHSKPKQKHWVSQALQLSGQQSCFQPLMRGSTPCQSRGAPRTQGPSFLSLMLPCSKAPFQSRHMANTAAFLPWAVPRHHGSKSTFVCRATWNNIQGNLERGFDLSFLAWTRHCCQYRLFSPISMIDAPAKNTVLAALVHICHHHLLFPGMSVYYKKTRFKGKKTHNLTNLLEF